MRLSEFSIFHADIFRNRSSHVREDLYNDVKYSDGFSMDRSNPKYAQYRLGLLLESILLYDIVFVELSEIPLIVYLWGSRYIDALTEIINNGTLRVVNRKETIITSLKRGKLFELGIGFQPNFRSIESENDMNELIHTIPKGKSLYSNLAKPLFNNAPKLDKDISLIVLDGIKNDFNINSLKSKLGLKSRSLEHYDKKEASIINRLSESYLRIAICEELRISNIFFDDVLLDTVRIKSENFVDLFDSRNREGFLKIVHAYNCPDITHLYYNGEIGLEEVLLLKKTPGFEVFRDWLTDQIETANDSDINNIVYDFINEVEHKTKGIGSNLPVKVLRWAVSILVGIKCPPAIGIAQSAFDSLFLDYFLEQKSPKLFLDDYYKIAK